MFDFYIELNISVVLLAGKIWVPTQTSHQNYNQLTIQTTRCQINIFTVTIKSPEFNKRFQHTKQIKVSFFFHSVVYRGCADAANLPGGVNTKEQCRYQGNSLWYFCEGDLCNNEQIGKTCGKPVYGPKYGTCIFNPYSIIRGSTECYIDIARNVIGLESSK